jgi:hypothetical protein
LPVSYAAEKFTIASASSYWTRTSTQTQDASEALQNALGIPVFDTAAGGAFGTTNLAHVISPLRIKEEAGFVHTTYQLDHGFKVVGQTPITRSRHNAIHIRRNTKRVSKPSTRPQSADCCI